ncbi:START domain-containing protein [Rufibacter psychrotolerans]|uniref:START domain-containing protein n=1 Tax=Rufibacter psychrotolerans TaxID=2812556 RepID=UPI001967AACD|nr:START domain-containing protein [Rufibacter sp. SYSU D00308]
MKRWRLGLLLVCWALTCGPVAQAQERWELRKDTDGIAVYTKDLANDAYKQIKVVCELPGTPQLLVNLLKDVERHQDWVYLNRKTRLLKKLSDNRLVYYTEADLPWPLTDRDMVVEAVFFPVQAHKPARVEVKSVTGYLPRQTGFVRIPTSLAVWEITPVTDRKVKVEYTFSVNPGGTVPAWLVNLTVATGPHKTFQNLRQILASRFTNPRR